MQQRRFRPGDVLDDYCPRERRITDHAVVAMIDDHIKQTRCVVCDAEHEYKEGKLPPQRRKRPQSALFAQVLDGLQAPQRVSRPGGNGESDDLPTHDLEPADLSIPPAVPSIPLAASHTDPRRLPVAAGPPAAPAPSHAGHRLEPDGDEPQMAREEGPVRRPLIRATLPRPEGQPVVTRALPEFTIRQPQNSRGGHRGGGRRRGAAPASGQGGHGARFGRGGHSQGSQGHGGRHAGGHGRPGGPRRGGKKR